MASIKVFISYSSRELEEALRLKDVIESNDIKCWMAPQSIPAGSDYGTEIPPAIKGCDVFILMLSQASQGSLWVPKEVDFALSNRKPIIPVHIDQSDIVDAFNFRLSNIQRIEAYERVSEAYEQLVIRLKAMTGEIVEKNAVKINKDNVVKPQGKENRGNKCPITFNTFSGKEYMLAKETKPELTYKSGPIKILDEKSFWILTIVNNLCPDDNEIAENVRLSMRIEKISDYDTLVVSEISCTNASPQKTIHNIHFLNNKPFELVYVKESALMYSEYYGLYGTRGMKLTDDILNDKGTLLGFWEIDGRIPGGINNSVTISIIVDVKRL